MAEMRKLERFTNAVIDINDMTITEFAPDAAHTYHLSEILKRWHGVPDIVLSISRHIALPPDGRE